MTTIQIPDWVGTCISIDTEDGGIRVFTIPTQHFRVKSLSDLTVERFEQARQDWIDGEELASELWKAAFEEPMTNHIREVKEELIKRNTHALHP